MAEVVQQSSNGLLLGHVGLCPFGLGGVRAGLAVRPVAVVVVQVFTDQQQFFAQGLLHRGGLPFSPGNPAYVGRVDAKAAGHAIVNAAKKGHRREERRVIIWLVTFHDAFPQSESSLRCDNRLTQMVILPVVVKRASMDKSKTPLPDWARKILKLRRSAGLTQAEFASRLHYSAMALSRWERGTHEPPAQAYIQIGNLTGEPDSTWFWERAGFKHSDLARMMPEGYGELSKSRFPDFEIVGAGGRMNKGLNSQKPKLVAVPVLAVHAATHGEKGDQVLDLGDVPATEMIAAPAVWCPHPAATNCLRVRGSSMSPVINEDDIVAVDCEETDPKQLSGKLVVTWQRDNGLTLSRFLLVNGVQLLESANQKYEPIRLGKNRSWRIIGRVLWSIRRAP
jgi:SOS-response transcriptional repressor LexA